MPSRENNISKSKTAGVSPNISIITVHLSGLIHQLKDRDWQRECKIYGLITFCIQEVRMLYFKYM